MKKSLIIGLALVSTTIFGGTASEQIKKLEIRVAKLEKALNPFIEQQNQKKARNILKAQAQARIRQDLKNYSRGELRKIEYLYQVANKKWRSQEGTESLKVLISKYKKANRTGCALLYLGQVSKGNEQVKYLKQTIKDFGDCYYGNGVQVGAYARFKLLWIYIRNGDKAKADKLVQEIKTNYPDAIDHRGNSLVAIINREFEKNK